ncbi:MAG: LysM peptidoglycan-binding domain-containing protein [Opitutales bacterium]|nr:LysM peptidoglycan-binding domain-containing protein [Opitutales bacterium]
MSHRLFISMACVLASLFWLACQPAGEVVRETDERAFRRAKSLLREDRKDEALASFMSVIDARADAAESHMEVGLLYLNHVRDPIAAVYHFRRYLGIKPNGEHADFVNELITTARKEFARTLPGEPFAPQVDRADLMSSMQGLRDENRELKEQLSEARTQLQIAQQTIQQLQQRLDIPVTTPTGPVAPIIIDSSARRQQATADGNATERFYTVQAGDTLSRISREVYGTTGRWTDIFEANRDQLPSPNALRVGQRLRIPQ